MYLPSPPICFLKYTSDRTDYHCVSSIHHPLTTASALLLAKDDPERFVAGLPVVSFHLTEEFHKEFPHVKQAAVSTLLRVKGWILPNYPLPPNEEQQEILRVVVRESFSTSIIPSYSPLPSLLVVVAIWMIRWTDDRYVRCVDRGYH